MQFFREWKLIDWLLLIGLIALIRWYQIEDRKRKYNPHTNHRNTNPTQGGH